MSFSTTLSEIFTNLKSTHSKDIRFCTHLVSTTRPIDHHYKAFPFLCVKTSLITSQRIFSNTKGCSTVCHTYLLLISRFSLKAIMNNTLGLKPATTHSDPRTNPFLGAYHAEMIFAFLDGNRRLFNALYVGVLPICTVTAVVYLTCLCGAPR